MTAIRIGIIGYGYWGPNITRNFSEMRSTELVAIADRSETRLEQVRYRYPHVHTTTDFRDLFDMQLDAVAIVTPPATHFMLASECLRNNLHVLVEKPLTADAAQARELIELAHERNRRLMVGHTFEFNPAVRAMKNMIVAGELGEIYYIDAVRTNLGLFQLNTDVMWDLGPHDISIINYLLGTEPLTVSATGTSHVMRNFSINDLVYMHMAYPDGVAAHVRLSWIDPNKTRRITVVGSKKMLVYDDVETIEKIRVYDKGVVEMPYTESYGEFQCSYRYGNVTIPHISWVEPLRVQCEHFIDSIRHGWEPQTNGESGYRVVKVLEAASESMRTGHAVSLTPENAGQDEAVHSAAPVP
jgi:predicted dehydrogenase